MLQLAVEAGVDELEPLADRLDLLLRLEFHHGVEEGLLVGVGGHGWVALLDEPPVAPNAGDRKSSVRRTIRRQLVEQRHFPLLE